MIPVHPGWRALWIAAGWTAASVRLAAAHVESSTLDDDWYVAVARSESLLAEVRSATDIDSVDRAALAQQMRLGIYVLGTLVHAGTSADTLLAGPVVVAQPYEPPSRGWRNRIARATGVMSPVTSLLSLVASLGGASPGTQRALAYVGSSLAGIGGLFHRSKPDPSEPSGSVARFRTVGLESELHDSVQQTEGAAESLWQDLRGMVLDSCTTADQIGSLARRYANLLPAATEVLHSGVARSAALAHSCSQHPGFDAKSRQRLGLLASRLDAVRELWQERQWLFERSRRNALDYLILVDRRP